MPSRVTSRPRAVRRTAAAAACVVGSLTLAAPVASAHVTARADSTAPGSFSQISFRVPNESPTAGTVKVRVELPQDYPLRFVSVKPVPGWTAGVAEESLPQPLEVEGTTITEAPRSVTWVAGRGTRIAPGEYQEFSVSAGPLPRAGALVLPATQTYSDGTVVEWDQPAPESGEDPERPAPSITVVDANSAPDAQPSEAADGAGSDRASVTAAADSTARWLAGAAFMVALSAVGLSARARRHDAS